MILLAVINNQDVINVIIQDYCDIVGTFINTVVIIYYLYITKFIYISNVNHEA